MKYQAILFDGDGTLWDFVSAMQHALVDAAAALSDADLRGPDGRPITAQWLKSLRDEIAALPQYAGASMEDIRMASFQRAVRECGRQDEAFVQFIYDRYMNARWRRLRTYPDVVPALERLSRSFRLALVTNGNTHPSRLGMERLFEHVVMAVDCGHHKPSPEIYLHTLGLLGLRASEVLHVGDDPVEDVVAARRAGIDAVWINRMSATWRHDEAPGVTVTDLAALESLLITQSAS